MKKPAPARSRKVADKTARGSAVTKSEKTPRVSATNKAEKTLAVLSSMLGRSRMIQRMAGTQYSGNRDIYAAAGYVPQGQVTFAHYWALYTRGDIAGRIVDMPAKTTWRTPPAIVVEGEPDGTPFTTAFGEMAKRLKLWSYLGRVDRLAGIGRYAALVLGVRGADDQQLKTPLVKVARPEDVIYLAVYHEDNAKIIEWVTDSGDPRFGLPKLYNLKTTTSPQFKGEKGSGPGAELLVHASRVIHVAEDVLEDDVFGRPRLERPLNRLFDLEKVAASTGEAYWQLVQQILQAKIDPEMEVEEPALKELDEKLGELVHDLRRQFYGQGVELSWLPTTTPNVTQVADFYFSLLAGSSGIPKRILFGSEMGELASTTDEATYFGMVNERQEAFAEPIILRQFIDRMILIGALPQPEGDNGEYQVNWPLLQEESDKENAETNKLRADAAAALTGVGGNPRELIYIDADEDIHMVERDADEPLEMLPPDMGPPPDMGASGGAGDIEADMEELKQEIADLEKNDGDPAEIKALKDELALLESAVEEAEEDDDEE